MIESIQIEKYSLSYYPTRTGEISFELKACGQENALKHPHRLLYIVKLNEQFLYVGEAKSELKTRFQRGFSSYRYFKRTGKARGGYKGYKWIKLLDTTEGKPNQLDIWAILFYSSYDEDRESIEAIEGEIVWEIRKRTHQWPMYQNEIHFNNNLKEARELANKILDEIK
jgi:hypothetical protein